MNPRNGATKLPEYQVWNQMRQRCENKNNEKYPIYGGRGITVCDRWKNFMFFLEDMGRRPSPLHSIDRIDNDGNYCKENCRWLLQKYQQRNRRNNRIVTIGNTSACLQEWCERIGVFHSNALRADRSRYDSIEEYLIRAAKRNGVQISL